MKLGAHDLVWVMGLVHALRLIPVIIAFRAIPLLCGLAFQPRPQLGHATRVVVSFALCAVLAAREIGASFLLLATAGYLYFFVLTFSLAKHETSREVDPMRPDTAQRTLFGRFIVFVLLLVLYVVVPATMFSAGSDLQLALMAWGWDRSLAAYSYIRRPRAATASIGAAFFFLFVNPELVFPGHAKVCPPRFVLGAARALWGAFLLAAVVVLPPWLERATSMTSVRALTAIGLQGSSAVVWLYAAHSGLAHLQLGLLRLLGFAVPERYRYPLFAASPREFWTRWNIYMASWVRVYLYLPIARRLTENGYEPGSVAALAGVLAFAGVGVLHAAYSLAQGSGWGLRSLGCFLTWGVLFVLFDAYERRVKARDATPRRRLHRICVRAFVAVATVFGARAIVAF